MGIDNVNRLFFTALSVHAHTHARTHTHTHTRAHARTHTYIFRGFSPRASPSLQAQVTVLQFCRMQVFHCKLRNQGYCFTRDRCGSILLLSAPNSLASERSEKIPGAPTWRWGEWIWLTGPSGFHRNSPQELNIVPSGFLTRSDIRKSQSPFDTHTHIYFLINIYKKHS